MSTKAIMIVAFALSTALTSPVPAQAASRSHAYDRSAGAYAQQVRRHHSAYRSRSVYNIGGAIVGPTPIRSFGTSFEDVANANPAAG
jgi:hypothetical protein